MDPGRGSGDAGHAIRRVAGCRVVDLCAAPGGKTAQLLKAGARVTAVDRSVRRLDRLVGNLERLSLSVEAVAADALTWRPEEPVERCCSMRPAPRPARSAATPTCRI